uniref:Uncharacterized protein n=1 Tax=Macaca fascicularis TaxID=9541 RepID=A0A7N9DAP4_MACFA
MLTAKTMGEMSPGHVRDLCGSPSHHRPRDLGGKNGFVGLGQGPPALCSLRTWCPVSQLLQLQLWLKGANVQLMLLLQRVQAPSLGGLHVVLGLRVHRSQKLRFGKLCLDFRGCMEMPGCTGRSLLQGRSLHGEPLLGQCRREMWGWIPHTESPLEHCLVELREEGHCPPDPKMIDPPTACTERLENPHNQCQLMKAARRGAVPCKATGAELPKAMGTHLLHWHDLDRRHGVKGDYFRVLITALLDFRLAWGL